LVGCSGAEFRIAGELDGVVFGVIDFGWGVHVVCVVEENEERVCLEGGSNVQTFTGCSGGSAAMAEAICMLLPASCNFDE
jgi:hypothetical protein